MKDWNDCENLLIKNNAPDKLIKHLYIVSMVATKISNYILNFNVPHNQELVICGAGLHDFGKIQYPEELMQAGSRHENEGKRVLLEQGVSLEIAQCCVSHAKWEETDKLEELLIALADKLWKGNRNDNLEIKVIDLLAKMKKVDRWDLFSDIDIFFENIASGATERLKESQIKKIFHKIK